MTAVVPHPPLSAAAGGALAERGAPVVAPNLRRPKSAGDAHRLFPVPLRCPPMGERHQATYPGPPEDERRPVTRHCGAEDERAGWRRVRGVPLPDDQDAELRVLAADLRAVG
ncbi:hypothetical protein ABZ816_02105 [Actinosynnema sp. NPDC047251]|nr:hypothetical protein [Saccharothrix espanaensis]